MERLIYWIKRAFRNQKNCSKCCVICKYYETCKEDNSAM